MSTMIAGAEHAHISRSARTLRRVAGRAAADPHVLLAIGLTLPTIVVHLGLRAPETAAVIALSLLYVMVQVILATAPALGARIGRLARPLPRLVLAVLFVTAVTNQTGSAAFRPLTGLYIPVVTMAAAYGGREALVVGGLAALGYLVPALMTGEHLDTAVQRGLVLASVTIMLVVGTRVVKEQLEFRRNKRRLAARSIVAADETMNEHKWRD